MKNFWDKVNKTEGCWNWTASNNYGYGIFRYKGKTYRANRFVWFLTYGEFPKKSILHTCDNPPCVNPAHLFEETQKENVRDMLKKGRASKGSDGKHKLTKEQVKEIKQLYIPYKIGYLKLSKKYFVTPEAIRQIISGVTWKQIQA